MKSPIRLVAACVVCVASLASSAYAESILEKIAVEVLAAKFNVSTAEIARIRTMSGLPVSEVAPIFSASSLGRTRADTVARLRRQGLGWGQIAQRIGMQPGTFNKLRVAGAFDSPRIWNGALSERFGVPASRITAVQKSGASVQDTIGAILVGKASGRSPEAAYKEYRGVRDWTTISRTYKIDFGDWHRYSNDPATTNHRTSIDNGAKSKGKVDGKPAKDRKPGEKSKGKSKGKQKGGGRGKR